MKIEEYLLEHGITQEAFAADVEVTQGAVSQWIAGMPPSPKKCVFIEKVTNSKVTRKDLRSDWAAHWPELAE